MVEYFCGARLSVARRILQTAVALALFCVVSSLSASAQNGTSRSNGAQAALHIRINVVPVLMAPPPQPQLQLSAVNSVSYNISTTKSNVEIIEETRPLSQGVGGGQGAILKTVTVVPR